MLSLPNGSRFHGSARFPYGAVDVGVAAGVLAGVGVTPGDDAGDVLGDTSASSMRVPLCDSVSFS